MDGFTNTCLILVVEVKLESSSLSIVQGLSVGLLSQRWYRKLSIRPFAR